jgi:glycine betaine/proline transport system permease protein
MYPLGHDNHIGSAMNIMPVHMEPNRSGWYAALGPRPAAFPLGILAARRARVEATLRPVLDVMQTVPPWVYLIPAVMIFSLGRVPAIIATIVYAIPPMLRLTTLAFKGVPADLRELGQAIGAKPRTILWTIKLPAARPTLLVGLNQCILLSLAMVVLAGLVGAGGLGAEVTRGLTRMEMGLGLRAGLGGQG